MQTEQARLEHAFLLRLEGLTYRKIGERLGVSYERARQMILKFRIKPDSDLTSQKECAKKVGPECI